MQTGIEFEAYKKRRLMSVQALVFHKGGLAHYRVSATGEGTYLAILQRYDGRQSSEPPARVSFAKESLHDTGIRAYRHLVRNLYETVKNRVI
jgi:hypothetical protein